MYQAKFEIILNNEILKRRTKVYDLSIKVDERIDYYINKIINTYKTKKIIITKIDLETLNFKKIIVDSRGRKREVLKNYFDIYEKKIRSRDYQRKKVYDWEGYNFNKYGMFSSNFNEEKMLRFCNHVLEKLNIPDIEINFIGNKNSSYFSFKKIGEKELLSLNFSNLALNKFLAIHELSHYIVYHKNMPDVGHGDYFVGVYAYLLINFIGFKFDSIYKTLDSRKIDYKDYNYMNEIFSL